MSFELRQLRYFVAIGETLSFTAAAAREGISQPALSRQIRNLESLLGVELVIRSPRTTLSPAGQHLLPRAKSLLAEAVKTELSVRQFAACRLHRLDVGYFSGPLSSFLSATLQQFRTLEPEVKVVLHELHPGEQIEELRGGRLDIALLGYADPRLDKNFTLFKLGELPLQLVMHASLARPGEPAAELNTLREVPLVQLNEQRYPGRRELLDNWCRAQGITPSWTEACDGLNSALMQVSSGAAVAILPAGPLTHGQGLVSRPLGGQGGTIQFHAATAPTEKRPPVRSFLNAARDHAPRLLDKP